MRRADSKSIVKPNASVCYRITQSWLTTVVFGYCNRIRIQLMHQMIRQHQLNDSIQIRLDTKIITQTFKLFIYAIVDVHHAFYGIKSKPVDMVLIHPPGDVGEQEALDFILTIIERHGFPCLVYTSFTRMRVASISAIKICYAIVLIERCVGVDEVQDDFDSHTVSLVYQMLEIIW